VQNTPAFLHLLLFKPAASCVLNPWLLRKDICLWRGGGQNMRRRDDIALRDAGGSARLRAVAAGVAFHHNARRTRAAA